TIHVMRHHGSESGINVLFRFGLYYLRNQTNSAETGSTIPAWLVVVNGTTFSAIGPPLPPGVTPTVPPPMVGYSVDVLADSDGSLLFGELTVGGGPPPAT